MSSEYSFLGTLEESSIRPVDHEQFEEVPEWDRIEIELDKLVGVENRDPNWKNIETNSKILISSGCSELKVVLAYCLARVCGRGASEIGPMFSALSSVCPLLPGLNRPAKKRSKIRLVEWFLETILTRLSNGKFEIATRTDCESLAYAFIELRKALEKSFEMSFEKGIRLEQELSTLVDRFKRRMAPTNTVSARTDESPNTSSVSSERVFLESVRGWTTKIHSQDSTLAGPYKQMRAAIWGNVLAMPKNNDGLTDFPGITADILKALESLEVSEKALGVIESWYVRFPFWFDLQKKSVEIASKLGPEYQRVVDTVQQETRQFVQQFSGIQLLKFSDGRPFAAGETQDWLKGPIGADGLNRVSILNLRNISPKWEKLGRQINSRYLSDPEQIARILDRGYNNCNDIQEKFQILLIASNFFFQKDKREIAAICFAELKNIVSKYKLNEWDRRMYRQYLELCLLVHSIIEKETPNGENENQLSILTDNIATIGIADTYKILENNTM